MRSSLIVLLLATAAFAASTSAQDQIFALLQTGTKASDAIDTVFDLLKDLKQSNADTQTAADVKNATDEQIGLLTISKFTEVMKMNQKLQVQSNENRKRFEQELVDTKNYLAWNEARQDEINRKMENLLDNQCFSNQLFVRSIKMNQECLEVVKLLKNDVAGYVTSGDSFELVQIPKSEVKTIADKLKKYSNIFNDQEVKSFLELANETEETSSSKQSGTVAERVLAILESLEENLKDSLVNIQQNEINASWELAGWVAGSQAELEWLATEHERKGVFADRLATQIQAALAQVAKSNIILRESQSALDSAINDLNNKRESYGEEKAKRMEENAILDEVITMFKKQVASYSGR